MFKSIVFRAVWVQDGVTNPVDGDQELAVAFPAFLFKLHHFGEGDLLVAVAVEFRKSVYHLRSVHRGRPLSFSKGLDTSATSKSMVRWTPRVFLLARVAPP